jgi:hypothetical protein
LCISIAINSAISIEIREFLDFIYVAVSTISLDSSCFFAGTGTSTKTVFVNLFNTFSWNMEVEYILQLAPIKEVTSNTTQITVQITIFDLVLIIAPNLVKVLIEDYW